MSEILESGIKDKTFIRNYVLQNLERPVALKNFLANKWPCMTWTWMDWNSFLGSEKYTFQLGERLLPPAVFEHPQWEYKNTKKKMTFKEFLDWQESNSSSELSSKTFWAYLSYYYMKNISNNSNEVLSWDIFGFPEIGVGDSTLWIGTSGANTPCHLDTYGSNIVCQISGRKRWTLFNKEDSQFLYPTRIPYEESSIYSEVGFPRPNVMKFNKLIHTKPYVVILEPGDVLFVPKHWWHFVENLELSISINTWIPLPSDNCDRLKEAFALYNVGSLCQSITDTSVIENIFNPNMYDRLAMDSTTLLEFMKENVLLYIKENRISKTKNTAKKMKLEAKTVPETSLKFEEVSQISFEEYCTLLNINIDKNSHANSLADLDVVTLLINTFNDDRVLDTMKMVLEEKINIKNQNL